MSPPPRSAIATLGALHATAQRLAIVTAGMSLPLAALLLDLARADAALFAEGRHESLMAACAAAAILTTLGLALSVSLLREARGLSAGLGGTAQAGAAVPPPTARPEDHGWGPSTDPVRVVRPGTLPRLRVLVVEDQPMNRKVAEAVLHTLGQDVALAADGAEGVAAAAAGRFDLILMDIHMPEMDGIAATRAIRESGADVPIFAMTASASEADRARCAEAGMDGFETKPLRLHSLATLLERVAARRPLA